MTLTHIKQWLEPPHFDDDEKMTAQAKALNTLIINFGAALLVFIFILVPFFAAQKIGGLILLIPPLIGLFIGRALIFRRQVRLGSALIILLSYLSFLSFTLLAGGPHSPGMFFISALILITGFFLSVRAANNLVILTILIALGVVFLESQGLAFPKIFVFTPLTGWLAFALGLVFMNSARNLILQNLEKALSAERQHNKLLQQTEQSLLESEEKFKAQYKGIPIPTFTWQAVGDDLILVDYNNAGLEFTSGRIADLLGKTASSVYRDDPGTFNEFIECSRTKSNSKIERWHRLASTGEMKYVAFNYAFVPPDLVMVHAEDITERKRMENILRESEETYKLMFESAPLAINITRGTDIIYANPSYLKMFGFSNLAELKNVAPSELFTSECRPQILENIQRRAKGLAVPNSYEAECIRKDGTKFPIMIHLTRTTFADGPATVAFILDITESKHAEEALRSATADYRAIFENSPVGVFQSTPQGRFRRVNPAMARIFGYTSSEEMIQSITDISHQIYVNPSERQDFQRTLAEHEEVIEFIGENYRKDKSIVWTQTTARAIKDAQGNILLYEGFITDITERKRAEVHNRLIAEVQGYLLHPCKLEDIYQLVSEKTKQLIGDGVTATSLLNEKHRTVRMGPYHGVDIPIEKVLSILGIDPRQKDLSLNDMTEEDLRIYRSGKLEVLEGGLYTLMTRLVPKPACYIVEKLLRVQKIYAMGFIRKDDHLGGLVILARNDITPHIATIEQIVNLATIAIERKLAEEALKESKEMLQSIFASTPDSITVVDLDGVIKLCNQSAAEVHGYSKVEQLIGKKFIELTAEEEHQRAMEGMAQVLSNGIVKDTPFTGLKSNGEKFAGELSVSTIKDGAGNLSGFVGITKDITERKQHETELRAIAALSAALRTAPTRSEMLPVIVKQVVVLLNCETASVEIIDPLSGDAVTEAAHGAWKALIGIHQKSGTGINAIISQTRQPYYTNDLKHDANFIHLELVDAGIHGSIGAPLIAQDNLIGFIWMGRKTNVSETEVRLLAAIADIAANAIYRSTLHEQTKKDADALALAYDTTLEGWAHALELRDHETEGHTRRVVQMTVDLAHALGIGGSELESIRRGALLHDIGKMGIPDSILLKQGSLDEHEWKIMRQHPKYAYKLLEPITYLRPVLEIPHYHHEKWDGTGYPYGLKGEKIPTAARIFAIVDVWDALTSDRPYRLAWSKEKALAHIMEQTRKHFDPAVVEAFLKIV